MSTFWSNFWHHAAIGKAQRFAQVNQVSSAGRAEDSKPCWQLLNKRSCRWAASACEWDAEQARVLLLCLGESAPLSDQCSMVDDYESLAQILLAKGAALCPCHFEAQCLRGQWEALAILIKESGDFTDHGGMWWLVEKLIGSEECIDSLETKLMFEQAKGSWTACFVSKELDKVLSQAKMLSALGQSVNRVGHNGLSARQCMQNFMENKNGQTGGVIARKQCEPIWSWIISESEREMLGEELTAIDQSHVHPNRL